MVQVLGHLQVERRFGDVGDLDDPAEPSLVGTPVPVRGDVLQRGLLAQRFQLGDGGFHGPQRVVRPGGDDQRQPGVPRRTDRLADQVVPVGGRQSVAGQRLLQAVREHDDLAVAPEQSPHLLRLGVGAGPRFHDAAEPFVGERVEVQHLLGVPQPDGDGERALPRQQLGQADDQRGLSGADRADDHVGAAGRTVPHVAHEGVAELIAPDHVAHDASGGLHDRA